MSEPSKKEMTLQDLINEHQRLTNQTLTFVDAIKDNTLKQVNLFMMIATKIGNMPPVENRAQRRAREKLEKKTKQ